MKKLILILIAIFGLSGCATLAQRSTLWEKIKQSEFLEHDTMYKNWEHMKYSLWGYKNPTENTLIKTQEERWWRRPQKWPLKSEELQIPAKHSEKKSN